MSDFQTIKNKLINENKIEGILEAIGCSYIRTEQRGFLTVAQLPDRFYSNNKRSVQVKLNNDLYCSIRNKAEFKGDIYSLISYLHHDMRGEDIQLDSHNAKDFICELFGWVEFSSNRKGYMVKKDYTACLKEIINGKKRRKDVKPNPTLSESILDEYIPYPSYDWIQEGISYETQKMYGIGFDLESKRITIPMRDRFGNLIGVKARIMKDEDDERKYLYLYKYNNSQELFNFHYAHPYIIMEKKVYVFEAEKSCMKMFENGVYNCVAVGSSSISDVQAELIKHCGLDVEIVMCFDIDTVPRVVKEISAVFTNRNVYGIIDTLGLLSGKMSPIDMGLKTFKRLELECNYLIHNK